MAAQFSFAYNNEFANLSKALRQFAPAARKEYLADIRRATAPAKTAIPESARKTLPRRGGLNETVAGALHITTRTSLSGPTAAVRIVCDDPPKHDIQAMNRGVVRHPTFGHRGPGQWKDTHFAPGFFTNPCVALAPGARREIAAGTDRMLRQIARAAL